MIVMEIIHARVQRDGYIQDLSEVTDAYNFMRYYMQWLCSQYESFSRAKSRFLIMSIIIVDLTVPLEYIYLCYCICVCMCVCVHVI